MKPGYAVFEEKKVTLEDMDGNQRKFGPSRIIIEPLEARHKSRFERSADWLLKLFIIGAAIYLVAEVVHAFSCGAIPPVGH